ncbi:MAG TPA: hypothetical protein DIS79_06365 [Bacteroidetes bacterium]|nr:hypothetical protein [Bacteroidota bacterium]HRK04088.1 hypothetical protein [Chlorobiota bacterium]
MGKTTNDQDEIRAFQPTKSYKIGKVKEGGNPLRFQWLSKPKAIILSGQRFIDHGCRTAQDYWDRNPFDAPQRTIMTIAEIDPQTQDEMPFSKGTHTNGPKVAASGLSDAVPAQPLLSTAPERELAHVIKVYEDQIIDLRRQLDAERSRNESLSQQIVSIQTEHNAEIRQKDQKISTLEAKVQEHAFELKYVNEKIIPKYKETIESQEGLSSQISSIGAASQPFQAALADKLVDKLFDSVTGFLTGKSKSSPAAPGETAVTSEDLGIAEVGQ